MHSKEKNASYALQLRGSARPEYAAQLITGGTLEPGSLGHSYLAPFAIERNHIFMRETGAPLYSQ